MNVWVTARPIKTTITASSAGHPYSKDCGLDGSKYTLEPAQHRTGHAAGLRCALAVPDDRRDRHRDGHLARDLGVTRRWRRRAAEIVLNDTVGGLRVAEIQSINGNGGN